MLNRQMRRQMRRRGTTDEEIARTTLEELAAAHKHDEAQRSARAIMSIKNVWTNTPWTESDLTSMRLTLHASFDSLVKGSGDERDFDGLGMAINVANVRACEIDPTGLLASKLEPAIDGFMRMKERQSTHGKLLFDGLGLEAARVAIDIYDQILELSTPRQMQIALQKAMQIVAEIKRQKHH